MTNIGMDDYGWNECAAYWLRHGAERRRLVAAGGIEEAHVVLQAGVALNRGEVLRNLHPEHDAGGGGGDLNGAGACTRRLLRVRRWLMRRVRRGEECGRGLIRRMNKGAEEIIW